VRRAVRSPDVQQRGRALERLLEAARRTPGLRADALALFVAFLDARLREGAACEEHPWPICAAGRGVQALGGSTVLHGVWHAMLAHPRSQVVETAALMVPELPDAAAYAVAHLRAVDLGPAIVEYPERIDDTLRPFDGRFVTEHAEGSAILIDGVDADHRATDVLTGSGPG
jgi:hypothetical protein